MATDKNPTILTVSPPKSKEEFVYQTLREAIITGQLEPGMEMVQTAIADQLNVSTIPVRSAIQRLATEGFVLLENNQSPTVTTLSCEELEELLQIRMHLELLAADLAFPNLKDNDLNTLWELVREMDEVLKDNKLHLYGALNKDFHMRMYETCRCPRLLKMIKDLWDNTDRQRSRSMFLLVPELAEKSNREHHKLLETIEDGKFQQAVDFLDEHKSSARNNFLEILKERRLTEN